MRQSITGPGLQYEVHIYLFHDTHWLLKLYIHEVGVAGKPVQYLSCRIDVYTIISCV